MQTFPSRRRGFTLIETIVAILLIVLVLGGLQGNATRTLQRLQDNNNESIATRLIQARAESLLASPCTSSSGTDQSGDVTATWQTTTDGTALRIEQTIQYQTIAGVHSATFHTIGVCP